MDKIMQRFSGFRLGSSLTLVGSLLASMFVSSPGWGSALPESDLPSGGSEHAVQWALPTLNGESSLADYLRYAALNNRELEAAFHRWKAALEKIPQARTLPDPKFTYGYYIEEVETRVGPQRHRFGLAQMFPWFGKRKLRGEVAAGEAEALYQQFQSVKLKLFYQVKDAWYELYYLRRAITITDQNVVLLKNLEGVAQTKYKAGGPLAGVIKAQVELGKLSDRLTTLNELRTPIAAKLNAALNRPPDAPVAWPAPITWQPIAVDEAVLAQWLETSNPELKGLDAMSVREEKAIALARKAYFPDVTLGLDYIDTAEALMPGVRDSGKDPLIATFSINLPLWTRKYRAGMEEARLQREAVLEAREQRVNTLVADLKMATYRFRDAERRIDLYAHTLRPLAENSLRVAQQSWESGGADFLELIDAQRLLLEFQLEEARARATREQRLAEMEMLVGREIPGPEESEPATNSEEPSKERQP